MNAYTAEVTTEYDRELARIYAAISVSPDYARAVRRNGGPAAVAARRTAARSELA